MLPNPTQSPASRRPARRAAWLALCPALVFIFITASCQKYFRRSPPLGRPEIWIDYRDPKSPSLYSDRHNPVLTLCF